MCSSIGTTDTTTDIWINLPTSSQQQILSQCPRGEAWWSQTMTWHHIYKYTQALKHWCPQILNKCAENVIIGKTNVQKNWASNFEGMLWIIRSNSTACFFSLHCHFSWAPPGLSSPLLPPTDGSKSMHWRCWRCHIIKHSICSINQCGRHP